MAILIALYIATEQIFVAKIKYFIFLSLKDNSSYPLGSNFLGRTTLQAAMTKLINFFLAFSFFIFPFLYDDLTVIRCKNNVKFYFFFVL